MKVILLEDVRSIGRKNEVKEVSDGFARNFLLKQGLAKAATAGDVSALAKKKEEDEKNKGEKHAALEKLAGEWREKELRFAVKSGGKSKAFGSVGEKEIRDRLRKDGLSVEKILLPKPLKELGNHSVQIELGLGVALTLKVVLEPEN